MAHYFLFPEKDTTIFSHPTRAILNTGIDEVLTIQDEESNTDLNFYPSRILIQFKHPKLMMYFKIKFNLVFLVQVLIYFKQNIVN
jgi:hypothetical protein